MLLKKYYKRLLIEDIGLKLNCKSVDLLHRSPKIILHMCSSKIVEDPKKFVPILTLMMKDICNQKAEVLRAKQSTHLFKLRKGMKIGIQVILKGDDSWNFLDLWTNHILPKILFYPYTDNISVVENKGTINSGLEDILVYPHFKARNIDHIVDWVPTFKIGLDIQIDFKPKFAYLRVPNQTKMEIINYERGW